MKLRRITSIFLFVLLSICGCAPHHQSNTGNDDNDDDSPSNGDDDDDDDGSPSDDDDDDDNNDNDDNDDDFVWSPMSGDFPKLRAVWGTSSNDVFAVGYDWTDEVQAVLHYDGVAWTRMNIEAGERGTNEVGLGAVWGTSRSDVFAGDSGGGPGPAILHYDGVAWRPLANGPGLAVNGIWGASSSDIYAVGYDAAYLVGHILHYDGRTWDLVDRVWLVPWAVWGASSSDVFVAAGSVLQYTGTFWRPMETPSGIGVHSIWGGSPSDVFGLGWAGENEIDVIVHYDGASWIVMNEGPFPVLQDVTGTSHNDVFAVGYNGIVHYDGSTWSAMAGGPFPFFYGVWGAGPGDVFAVGAYSGDVSGAIYHYGPPTGEP